MSYANTYLSPVIAIPSTLEIIAITQANPAVLTVTENIDQVNTYIPGQVVKINVPVTYGMWQINNISAPILLSNGPYITVNINSMNFDPFVIPPEGSLGPATISPSGSQNLQYNNITNQVAFQSLNNIGN